ncbi:MAG: TetR-like C-terminal domain-containing protein [Leptospira sp.]|nr:TetR-like C-terminal domain-containing protein [Leptospira sp.]
MGKRIKHKHGRPNKSSRVLTREIILTKAWDLACVNSFENLSIKSLAESLEIRPPSLYNHINDLSELKNEISSMAMDTLSEKLLLALESAKTSHKKIKLSILMRTYRDFAHQYKNVYGLILSAPRENLAHKIAAEKILNICLHTLDLKELDTKAIHKIRILRATLHGFVSLELVSGFGLPESVNETFERLIEDLSKSLLS